MRITIFAALLLACGTAASADEGDCGGQETWQAPSGQECCAAMANLPAECAAMAAEASPAAAGRGLANGAMSRGGQLGGGIPRLNGVAANDGGSDGNAVPVETPATGSKITFLQNWVMNGAPPPGRDWGSSGILGLSNLMGYYAAGLSQYRVASEPPYSAGMPFAIKSKLAQEKAVLNHAAALLYKYEGVSSNTSMAMLKTITRIPAADGNDIYQTALTLSKFNEAVNTALGQK